MSAGRGTLARGMTPASGGEKIKYYHYRWIRYTHFLSTVENIEEFWC